MTTKLQKASLTLLASLTSISALLAATDPSTLNLDAVTWAWITLALAVAVAVAGAVNQAFGE